MAARFDRACRLLRLPLDAPMVVATSGGADSAVALLLMRQVAPSARLIACYVDHGIRPKASIARDLAAVHAQARAAQASVRVESVTLAPKGAGSPEERARLARYTALAQAARETGCAVVIAGHQQDDLVETSLLALIRGSGIDGVAAMRPMRALADGVTLARPLLWASKAQCYELARALSLPISEDETNADVGIPRNAVRASVSRLEHALPGAARGIGRSAALLADDKLLLDRMSAAAFRRARTGDRNELSVAMLRRMPIALVRRVIRYAVVAGGSSLRDFSFEHCNAIAVAIKEKRGGRFHAGVARVILSAGKLIFETAPQSPSFSVAPVAVDLDGLPRDVDMPGGRACLKLIARSTRAAGKRGALRLDLTMLRAAAALEIRLPRQGDTCIPSGRSRPVSLARFLGKSGLPKFARTRVPVLCAGGRIAAVLGVRVMEPFKPKGQGPVLEVAWRPTDM